ncbi:MAG: hypothetical protein P8Q14_00530, partial [Vicingaceae bacterium]|nr:hypothetical protein [Vicingaceae bacterium]
LLHLISDSTLSFQEIIGDSLVQVEKLYDESFWTYFFKSYHDNNRLILSFNFERNDNSLRWVFLNLVENKVHRYNFIYEDFK